MAKSAREYADEFANMDVDYQGILDRFNAATEASLSRKRAQLAQTENKFYNQMYDTQRTALDTIRQSNARAVSTGASRGMQAANELSAILGLQEQSVETASQLAQASQDLAAEESEAVLNNVLQAYQQAKQEQQTNVQLGLQAEQNEITKLQYAQAQSQSQREYEQSLSNNLRSAYESGNVDSINVALQDYIQGLGINLDDLSTLDVSDYNKLTEQLSSYTNIIDNSNVKWGRVGSNLGFSNSGIEDAYRNPLTKIINTYRLADTLDIEELMQGAKLIYTSYGASDKQARQQEINNYFNFALQRALYQRLANDYNSRGLTLTGVMAPTYTPSNRVLESLTQGLNRASINAIKTLTSLFSFPGYIAHESAESALRDKAKKEDPYQKSEDFWDKFGKKD